VNTEAEGAPVKGFLEERTGWRRLKEVLLLEPLPGGARWAAAMGSLLLFAFVVQVVTGILLAMNYAPSEKTAWPSVNYIQQDVPLGAFIRAVHHWGSSAMVILLLVHLVQVFVWGAYKKPREITWMVGVLLLLCTLGLAFTGYLLPWDQKAYWATKVGLGIAGTTPFVGDGLRALLQGGPQLGNLTLTRFFALHGFVLPGAIVALVIVHLYLFRQHGVTPPWWRSAAQLKQDSEPFWPRQALKDGALALLFLVGLGVWAYYRPAPLEAPADPSQPYEARPEWYFMFLFQILRYFHGSYEVVGTFVLPTLFVLVLLFWPFLDRSPHRNPARRPVAMGLLGAGTASLIGLTVYAITTDVRMQEPAAAVAQAPPAPPAAGPLQKLEVARLYEAQCAACHGVDGTGAQLRASLPTLPDFTSLGWQMAHSELDIAHRITDGREPVMPAYRDKLTREQNLALTIYVRYFARETAMAAGPPAPGPAPPGKEPPGKEPPVASRMSSAQLYGAYCLGCHEADGRGSGLRKAAPTMPDFTDPKWQAAHKDAELAATIRDGKGKLMLPMKDKLAAADIEQLVPYVRAFKGAAQVAEVLPKPPPQSPDKPPVRPEPVSPPGTAPAGPTADELAGRRRVANVLYQQYCLACHGTDGTGAAMRASMPTIPDFTSRAFQEARSKAQLSVSVLDGKGTLMPPFRGRITEGQLPDLVAYVRALGPIPIVGPAEKSSSGDDFDEQYRRLMQEWDALHKQFEEMSKKPPKK
jgi:quinol-cytochrome oxidoreductase complex cytochrome b subunit/mono/diheme cytochrome c family protein